MYLQQTRFMRDRLYNVTRSFHLVVLVYFLRDSLFTSIHSVFVFNCHVFGVVALETPAVFQLC
jgi:hypothetical protein